MENHPVVLGEMLNNNQVEFVRKQFDLFFMNFKYVYRAI